MKRFLVVIGLAALAGLTALAATGTATATPEPGTTLRDLGTISDLAVTHRSVAFAVREADDGSRCAYVGLWDTATKGLWRLGQQTTRICKEGPSTGSGISSVATSGRRVFWVTYGGGNFREETLWTATPARATPRRLADASSDVDDGERPIVLGDGTREGVPYAVRDTVTYVADNGARLFRVSVPSEVRLLAAGIGPGSARVVAALADGTVVTLSSTGQVLRQDEHEPGSVKAIGLALPGPIVQIARVVSVGSQTVSLPTGALVLDFRQGQLVYRLATKVRARRVATGTDTLLQVIPVKPWQGMPFSTDSWGTAWAKGAQVSWRAGPLS